jgi:hypothetical protein
MQPTPAAFMSYVEQDNQYVGGRLTELGQRLSAAVRFHIGENFVIFQEQLDVAWGQNWQERIHASLVSRDVCHSEESQPLGWISPQSRVPGNYHQ